MSRCVDLHCDCAFFVLRFDLHCDMSGDWGSNVFKFVLPLPLSQLCQPDRKKQFIKNYYQIRSTGFAKQKTNFLPPR